MLINLMALQGGWQMSGALPLSLSCFSSEQPLPLLRCFHLQPLPHNMFWQRHVGSVLSDPVHRLLVPRLPTFRSRDASSRAPRPLRSFCIKDILGKDADSAGDFRSPPSSRRGALSLSSCGSETLGNCCEAFSSCAQSNVRVLSASPSTPASTSGCPSPRDQSCLSPGYAQRGQRIVRPWVPHPCSPHPPVCFGSAVEEEEEEEEEDEEISVDDDGEEEQEREQCSPRPAQGLERSTSGALSPLDALMALTSKTLTGMHSVHHAESRRREHEALLFSRHGGLKKRRKSRTAFSNQQIYQLEQRFLYQKYLTPADRDHIAHTLGLSSAQVITWFQNRRAKLKRDLEELKNDVTASKKHSVPKPSADRQTNKHLCHHAPHQISSEAGVRENCGKRTACASSLSTKSSPSSLCAQKHVNSSRSAKYTGTSPPASGRYCSTANSIRANVGFGTLCCTKTYQAPEDSPVSVSDDEVDSSASPSGILIVTATETQSESSQKRRRVESDSDYTGRISVGFDCSPLNDSDRSVREKPSLCAESVGSRSLEGVNLLVRPENVFSRLTTA